SCCFATSREALAVRGRHAALFASHICYPLHRIRQSLRVRLRVDARLGVALTLFSGCAVFLRTRFVFLDPAVVVRRRWARFIQMARTARGHSAAGWRAGVLSFHGVLSGLGRHLFFRESIFHFVDTAIYSWTERSAGAPCCAVSQSTRSRCRGLRGPCRVHALERGVHVSVGRAPDSAARSDFLERNDSQPIQRRAAPVGRASAKLSFSSS